MSLAAALAAVKANPLAAYQPTPGQLRFHKAPGRVRLLRAPNQVGKSHCGAAEALWWLLGKHPHQAIPPAPNRGRLVPYSDDSAKEVEARLAELLPRGSLHPDCRYDADRGFRVGRRRILRLRNGSSLSIISQEAGTMAAAGATLDFVWFDEPPPPSVFSEGVARTTSTGGRVWLTLTPIGRPCAWLREEVERGSVEEIHFGLSVQSCPWLTQADVDQITAHTLEGERPQRIHGDWEGVTPDRYYGAWADALVTDELPDCEVKLGLGIDHGEDAGREAALLVAFKPDRHDPRCWFLDEYVSRGHTGIEADAQGILDMLARWDLGPEAIDEARGDTNSAGKSEAGYKVNQLLTEAVARMSGLPEHSPPFRIQPARKGPGSVAYTSRLLHSAMVRGGLTVHPNCASLIEAFRHWRGPGGSAANRDLSHSLDAARYIGREFLDTRARTGAPLRIR